MRKDLRSHGWIRAQAPPFYRLQVQEAGRACFTAPSLIAAFRIKGELESVKAEEQIRTERPRLERTRRASTPTREGAGPPALGKQSCVFHQTAAVLRVWVTGRPARPSAKLAAARKSSVEKAVHRRARRNPSRSEATTHATWPCMVLRAVPHALLVLLLPRAFAAPYLTPQGAHHHHPNHGDPELHAKPNGIQCVHRPPPLTTGCTPIQIRDAQSPVEHPNHEGQFWKKRWYLGLSVNGCSTAFESLRTLANALDHPGT